MVGKVEPEAYRSLYSPVPRANEEFLPTEVHNIECDQWYYTDSTRERQFSMRCELDGVWVNHSIPYTKCVMWIECEPPVTGVERLLTNPPGNIRNDTERR